MLNSNLTTRRVQISMKMHKRDQSTYGDIQFVCTFFSACLHHIEPFSFHLVLVDWLMNSLLYIIANKCHWLSNTSQEYDARPCLCVAFSEDAKQENDRSANEVEELQQQLSKAAADAWPRKIMALCIRMYQV